MAQPGLQAVPKVVRKSSLAQVRQLQKSSNWVKHRGDSLLQVSVSLLNPKETDLDWFADIQENHTALPLSPLSPLWKD